MVRFLCSIMIKVLVLVLVICWVLKMIFDMMCLDVLLLYFDCGKCNIWLNMLLCSWQMIFWVIQVIEQLFMNWLMFCVRVMKNGVMDMIIIWCGFGLIMVLFRQFVSCVVLVWVLVQIVQLMKLVNRIRVWGFMYDSRCLYVCQVLFGSWFIGFFCWFYGWLVIVY